MRTFVATIDALKYPERPSGPLFVRGDVGRPDDTLPRFIPDTAWHRFVAAANALTPDQVAKHRLPLPYERTKAAVVVLLECGLQAGELCALDTGCLIAAEEATTGQTTHWLRVPVGKLHNDPMVPVRPTLVAALDTWMRRRGPQPLLPDERTGRPRDFLFTWQGTTLSPHSLNELIARICASAGVDRVTSHQFRHTLAVQWRKSGMKIETIGRLLGHRSLQMTLRYAAVMPETVRREFDQAFAAIDDEYRTASEALAHAGAHAEARAQATTQVRVLLSPQAHLAASVHWRELLWVDLGIGFCGLSAYLPCGNRLACLPCPHFVEKPEHLPVLREQRANLIELRLLGERAVPAARQEELADAVAALDRRLTASGDVGASNQQLTDPSPGDGSASAASTQPPSVGPATTHSKGEQHARTDDHC